MDSEFQQKLSALKIDRDEDHRSGGGRVWIVVVVLLIAAGSAVAWWLLRERAQPVRTAQVQEVAATGSGAASVLNASGYVTARRQATVSSKFTGKVVEVLVEEGMKVEKGQVLARLDDSQERLNLGMSRANLEAAQFSASETEARLREANIRKQRFDDLVAKGIASRSDWDAVEAEVDALRARLESQRQQIQSFQRQVGMAQQTLDDTVIRAPFSGVAISKNAQPGEIISPMSAGGGFTRTGISTVVDMSSLEVEVDVNEAYIQRVQPAQKVLATLDAYPEAPIPSHVITTIPAADRQKATVTVRIGFDQLDARILPDMGVKVAFLSDAPAPDAAPRRVVRVPRAAVRGIKGEEFVFVVGGDKRLERRAIKLAAGSSDPVEVVAGLRAGESIVVEGSVDLSAGTLVRESTK
ncbi:MAG: efflux RND transporter periplasmic adaptor subunit [Acidobacteriota bacterium]